MCLVTTFAIPHTPVSAVNSIRTHSCDGKRRNHHALSILQATDRRQHTDLPLLPIWSFVRNTIWLIRFKQRRCTAAKSAHKRGVSAKTAGWSVQKLCTNMGKQAFRSGKQRRNRQRRTPNKRHAFYGKRLERNNRYRCIVTSLVGCLTAAFFIWRRHGAKQKFILRQPNRIQSYSTNTAKTTGYGTCSKFILTRGTPTTARPVFGYPQRIASWCSRCIFSKGAWNGGKSWQCFLVSHRSNKWTSINLR